MLMNIMSSYQLVLNFASLDSIHILYSNRCESQMARPSLPSRSYAVVALDN